MAEGKSLKSVYKIVEKIQSFYTGGMIRLAPKGDLLFCTQGESISLVDVATGTIKQKITEETDITSFAIRINPKNAGLEVLLATVGQQIKHWEISTGTCLRSWKGHTAPILDMCVNKSGSLLATSSSDRSVLVWDIDGGFCTHSLRGHKGIVIRVLFSPYKPFQLLSACDDGAIRIWDLSLQNSELNLKHSKLLENHFGGVTCLKIIENGSQLISAGRDKVVTHWDLKTCKSLKTIPVFEGIEVLEQIDNNHVIIGGESGVLSVWNFRTGQNMKKEKPPAVLAQSASASASTEPTTALSAHHSLLFLYPISSLSKSNGKTTIHTVAANGEHNIIFHSIKFKPSKKHADKIIISRIERVRQLVGFHDEIFDIKLLPFLKCDNNNNNNNTEDEVNEKENNLYFRMLVATNSDIARVITLPFSRDNIDALIAKHKQLPIRQQQQQTLPQDLTPVLNKSLTNKQSEPSHSIQQHLVGHQHMVVSVDVNKEGTMAVTGSRDHSIRLWDLRNSQQIFPKCLAVGKGHSDMVSCVAFGKKFNSKVLLSGGKDKTVKLWKMIDLNVERESSEELVTIFTQVGHERDVNAVAVAPNDAFFASCSLDRTIKIWKVDTKTMVGTLRGHKKCVWDVSFSPVDKCVVSASADKTIKIWSLSDFSCLKTFEGHLNSVLKVSFISNGMQLISTGADGVVKLWEVKSSECVNSFTSGAEQEDKLWALALNHNINIHNINNSNNNNDDNNDNKDNKKIVGKDEYFVTGGVDSVICLWKDFTVEEAELKIKEQQEIILKEQTLKNKIKDKDWKEAVFLAFELEQPGRVRVVFEEIFKTGDEANSLLEGILLDFSKDQISLCLRYIRDWNTNANFCIVAHKVLNALLTVYTLDELKACPGAIEIVKGISAYTDRHFQRLERLQKQSFILDFVLHQIQSCQ